MSAIPVLAIETTHTPVRKPDPSETRPKLGGACGDLHVALIRKLQLHARGVTRKRRFGLHRQFAWEWRHLMDRGGIQDPEWRIPQEEYPLLRTLVNQVVGRGEPILIS